MPTLRNGNSARIHEKTTTTSPMPPADDGLLPPPVLQSSPSDSRHRRSMKSARISKLAVYWHRFKRRIGTVTAPSTSSVVGESAGDSSYARRNEEAAEDKDEVNKVVVDRVWSDDIKTSVSHSENGAEKSGGSHQPTSADHESFVGHAGGVWTSNTLLLVLRWRLWPAVMEFFSSRFFDDKFEARYRQENWFLRKV